MKIFIITNKEGEEVAAYLENDPQCLAAQGRQPINESCGGCAGCLIAQAIHYGFNIREEEI